MMSFWTKLKNWILHSGVVHQQFDPNEEVNQLKYLLFGRYSDFELHDLELINTAKEKLNAGCVIIGGHAYDVEYELDFYTSFNLFVKQNDDIAKGFPCDIHGLAWLHFVIGEKQWSEWWLAHEEGKGILLIGREEQLQCL